MSDREKAPNGPFIDNGGNEALFEDFCRTSIEDGCEHPAAPAPVDQLGLGLEEDDCPQPKVFGSLKRKWTWKVKQRVSTRYEPV